MAGSSTGSVYGNSIADFIVEGEAIGNGGFSEVFRARSRLTDDKVAIKFIARDENLRDLERLKRVKNEITVHKQLKHPCIVSFYTAFQDEDYVYLVMELFEEDLEHYLKVHDLSRDPRRIKEIFWQIVRGLEYLHLNGIIHRDLKPGNILLKNSGKTAKICDFGLATITFNSVISKGNSTFCGTPDFMAPEMFVQTKNRKIEESADIWSLAVLLYTMLTGDRPFKSTGKTMSEIGKERKSPEIDFSKITDYNAQDLVRRTMSLKEEKKRLSASEILQHPWLSEVAAEKARLLSDTNLSLDSGNSSSSNISGNIRTPDRILGVITENSFFTPPTNQSANQPTNQSTNQLLNQSANQSTNHCMNQLISQSANQSTNYCINPCVSQSTNQSMNFSSLDRRRLSSGLETSLSGTQTVHRVVPVDTEYLKAQRVKVGETVVCSIVEGGGGEGGGGGGGEVVVEFLRVQNGQLWVTDVVRMYSKSREVKEYEVGDGCSVLLTDAPPPLPFNARTHLLPSLPSRVRKGCLIALAFVQLVKSKTVKCWIQTDRGRTCLMRNEPCPNVESVFRDGVKVLESGGKVEVKGGGGGGSGGQEVKREFADHWQHHVWCREYLLETDRQTRELEEKNPHVKIIAMGYGRKQSVVTVQSDACVEESRGRTFQQPPFKDPPFSRSHFDPPRSTPVGQSSVPSNRSTESPLSGHRGMSLKTPTDRSLTQTDRCLTQTDRSVTSLSESGSGRATVHRFTDGVQVTVFNGGEFLKFEDAIRGSHTWLLAEVPLDYDGYVSELQAKGHLQRGAVLGDRRY